MRGTYPVYWYRKWDHASACVALLSGQLELIGNVNAVALQSFHLHWPREDTEGYCTNCRMGLHDIQLADGFPAVFLYSTVYEMGPCRCLSMIYFGLL